MSQLFPSIESNGDITELVYRENAEYYERVLLPNPGQFSLRTNGFYNVEGFPETLTIAKELFKRMEFSFRIDKRVVTASVFVHERFMNQYRDGARERAIEAFVKERSPWFFSYAKRMNSIIEDPSHRRIANE